MVNLTNAYNIPEKVSVFKQEIINEVQEIGLDSPDIERLLDTLISVTVKDFKLVKTEKGVSNEGQILSGNKLLVNICIKEKTMYVADYKTQPVHAECFETHKSFFIILPEDANECDIEENLKVTPYIESFEAKMLDARHIQKCIMLLINVN
ncbi:MAG: hypothetical protein R3Y12_05660 [Clostridia bacterium]